MCMCWTDVNYELVVIIKAMVLWHLSNVITIDICIHYTRVCNLTIAYLSYSRPNKNCIWLFCNLFQCMHNIFIVCCGMLLLIAIIRALYERGHNSIKWAGSNYVIQPGHLNFGATAASLYLHLYLADSILILQSFLFSMVKGGSL